MTIERMKAADAATVMGAPAAEIEELDLHGFYTVKCFRDGELVWEDTIKNLVTTEGKNALLTNYLKGSTFTQVCYMGLVESTGYTSYNATNTAANITAIGGGSPTNGWNEATSSMYAARLAPSFGSASGGSLATSSAVDFTINTGCTIKGCFLLCKSSAGVSPTSTVGNTSGALHSCGNFTGGDRVCIANDHVQVTYTASA